MRFAVLVALGAVLGGGRCAAAQVAHELRYAPGKSIVLRLPAGFDIDVAANGLGRVRFLTRSPDGRIFATGMYNLADNTRGSVFILDGWDSQTHSFTKVRHYLDRLRNPNNVAFWTDPATGQAWLYLALTDRLVRYRYAAGDVAPSSQPETLMRFPDYGLSYKYGGWHLTRTVVIAPGGGKARVFVAVGSSCNYCQETEVARASIVSMDPDGGHPAIAAQGLRNAVGLAIVTTREGSALFATDMGDDHLGDALPEDPFFRLELNVAQPPNYGWPTCYFAKGKAVYDRTPLPGTGDRTLPAPARTPVAAGDSAYGRQAGVAAAGTNLTAGGGHAAGMDPNAALGHAPAALKSCERVPVPYVTFAAHSSPLGFEHFTDADPMLGESFMVALHGAGHPRVGSGYRVVRVGADRSQRDFITGFLTTVNGKPVIHGRPCGLLRTGPDSFLLTDDFLGLVYSIHPGASREGSLRR